MSNDSVPQPRILTNMQFWQSSSWRQATHSIYKAPQEKREKSSLPPLLEALKLFNRSNSFDVIVTMGARESLYYGLLSWLIRRRSGQILTEFFVDEERKGNLIWRLKNALYTIVVRNALGVLTNSSAEVEIIAQRFGLEREELRYVPMHSNIQEPRFHKTDEGYILAAGRTLRDYPVLMQAAEEIPAPIHVVCGAGDLRSRAVPANIRIHTEIPRDVYLDLLKRCAFAVLPLIPAPRSTGQVVALEAMAFGKPVVATHVVGMTDLIEDGETGFLVDPGDTASLAKRCRQLLDQPELRKDMGLNALQAVRDQFLIEQHAKTKLKAIHELWQQSIKA
jgi:glycosyltransferase involved in cell wall biosynthesis